MAHKIHNFFFFGSTKLHAAHIRPWLVGTSANFVLFWWINLYYRIFFFFNYAISFGISIDQSCVYGDVSRVTWRALNSVCLTQLPTIQLWTVLLSPNVSDRSQKETHLSFWISSGNGNTRNVSNWIFQKCRLNGNPLSIFFLSSDSKPIKLNFINCSASKAVRATGVFSFYQIGFLLQNERSRWMQKIKMRREVLVAWPSRADKWFRIKRMTNEE